MARTPREGQIWETKTSHFSGWEIHLTDPIIECINRSNRRRGYRYVRTPFKVRIRHFFEDLLKKLRK